MRIEIRSNDCAIVEGYVNVVGRRSKLIPTPRGKFVEVIEPGTFKKALEHNPNVKLKFNHQRVLGDVSGGALELREDNIGLYAKATVTDEEVINKGRNGQLTGWSFGFTNPKADWQEEKRYLKEIELTEVSILDKTPAYPATSIEIRNDELTEYRAFEDKNEIIDDVKNNDTNQLMLLFAKQQIEIFKMKG